MLPSYETFQNPPVRFRDKTFWSWNDNLEPKELQRQIRVFHKMGLGGFFMHSRVGLATPYLGPEWFDCVRACIQEAGKLGLEAWLYDEDRWPSGYAGGLVTRDDALRGKVLQEIPLEATALEGEHLVARFALRLNEKGFLLKYRPLPEGTTGLRPGETGVRYSWACAPKQPCFNGESYLDVLNPAAVGKFIEATHEAYAREIGNFFGKEVPGFFTDEPRLGIFGANDKGIPWTPSLPEAYRRHFSCEIDATLPELFHPTDPPVSRARWQYREILTEMFVASFAKQTADWCHAHGLALTGHVMAEDDLAGQTLLAGSAMRFYEQMPSPGIDLLTDHWNIFATVKQCTSVARQCGASTRLSECYGVTGWDFPLYGHKAIGDWQLALGINSRCLHLAWYSMAGQAKRDYPASIHEHSPWHEKYLCIENYFARIHSVLSGGKELRHLLVIHPLESCWGILAGNDFGGSGPHLAPLQKDFLRLTNRLLQEHLDFDYGDEEMLSRLGTIDGQTLRLGKADYSAVLLPPMMTLRHTTLETLRRFADHGGKVYFLGAPPPCTDAVPSSLSKEVFQYFQPLDWDNFSRKIGEDIRTVSVTASGSTRELAPVMYHIAQQEDGMTLFLCNTGMDYLEDQLQGTPIRQRNQSFPDVEIRLFSPHCGRVLEFHPDTGEITAANAIREQDCYRIHTSFAALESRLFVITSREYPLAPQAKAWNDAASAVIPWEGRTALPYSLEEPNVLILDQAEAQINGQPWLPRQDILLLDDHLRHLLGLPPRSGNMIQPWAAPKATGNAPSLTVTLRFSFYCQDIPPRLLLAVEKPELLRQIRLNGTSIPLCAEGFWVHRDLQTIPLPAAHLHPGTSQLEISLDYSGIHPGLEHCFLLGDFGVENDVILRRRPQLQFGDWRPQGLPYYAGNVHYQLKLPAIPCAGRVRIRFPRWEGTLLSLRCNHDAEQILLCPPFAAILPESLKRDGTDMLEITVYGHRRNALGPLYLQEEFPAWPGPASFRRKETEEKHGIASGLLEAPVLEREFL